MATMALLLDAGYFDKLMADAFAERAGGRKVPMPLDMKRLPAMLAGGEPRWVYYYYCMPWVSDPPLPAEQAAYEAKRRFIDFLGRQRRWVLREGALELRGETRRGTAWVQQKRVDVLLAIDLVKLAWRKEAAEVVLVAGDSDFVPAVEEARQAGVRVRLRYAPGTAHPDLIAACDEAAPLTREALEAIRLPRG